MRKKLLAIVMTLTMILAFMPAMAFADESGVTSIEYRLSNGRTEVIMYEYEVDDYDYQPCQGDHLIVVTSGGETAYMYDEEEGEVFISRDGDAISLEDVQFELVSDEGKYKITVEYEGKSNDIPVKVLGDNVSDITYTPKSAAITLYEGVDEIEEIDDDDSVVTYFDVRNAYDYLYGYGNDKVDIEYTDGTPSETLALDDFRNWDYVTAENGEYISLYEAQQQTPWEVGDTYDIYLKAKGKIDTNNKITVTIRKSPYYNASFSFTQSDKFLYAFETEGLEYDSDNDEYVLNDTKVGYYGSEGDTLIFTLGDGSEVKFEYGRIVGDPDYPRGWDGFVTTDASGNKVRPEREILFKDKPLRWTKDSDGHYINTTAKLTYMGAVSDEPVVSYAGNQVWFDPNGGDIRANTAVPLGMSVNDLPNDWLNIIQPSRSGYTFAGWYERDPQTGDLKADPFNFDTKIEEETFLFAKWEKAVCEHKWVYGVVEEQFNADNYIATRTDNCSVCGATRIGLNTVVEYEKSLPKVSAAKGKAGKKKLTAKWKKVSKKNQKKIAGIEIQVSGPGVDSNKLYTVGKGKTSKTIKVPNAKTKYKYRIRTYMGSGTNKQVSKWSGWKTVKVK